MKRRGPASHKQKLCDEHNQASSKQAYVLMQVSSFRPQVVRQCIKQTSLIAFCMAPRRAQARAWCRHGTARLGHAGAQPLSRGRAGTAPGWAAGAARRRARTGAPAGLARPPTRSRASQHAPRRRLALGRAWPAAQRAVCGGPAQDVQTPDGAAFSRGSNNSMVCAWMRARLAR